MTGALRRVIRRVIRRVPAAAIALPAALLVLAACGAAPGPAPDVTPAVTLELAAQNLAFDKDQLTVPAGSPFAIRLDNREAVPHNVSVRGGPAPMVGEVFTGPAVRTTNFAALPAGSYTFICDVHPEMVGTLISQ